MSTASMLDDWTVGLGTDRMHVVEVAADRRGHLFFILGTSLDQAFAYTLFVCI